jgi:hypothetical protein
MPDHAYANTDDTYSSHLRNYPDFLELQMGQANRTRTFLFGALTYHSEFH